DNLFAEPGGVAVGGTPVDLAKIDSDVYVLGALADHIVPWQACYRSAQLFSGHTRFVAASGGHIQSLVNPPGNPRSRYRTGNNDLTDAPKRWRRTPTEHAATWWDNCLDCLEPRSGATKVAPTRLGAGSHPPLARQAVRRLARFGFSPVDVLGVSLGGGIAQQVAIRYPERVRRLVVASTTWGMPAYPGRISAWRTRLSPARYYLPGHYGRRAADFLGGRIGRDPVLAHRYGETRRAHPPRPVGHLYQLCGGATWTNLPWLHRIQAPTLVLSGDDDPLVPLPNARILAR